MARQPVQNTDVATLVLVNQVGDLQRQVTDLRRDLEEKRKENDMLYAALERPAVSTMTEQQIYLLSELVFQRIMGFPIKKENKPDAPTQ